MNARLLLCGCALLVVSACAGSTAAPRAGAPVPVAGSNPSDDVSLLASPPLRYPANAVAPSPDPRIGLKPGFDTAGEAIWNLRLVAHMAPSEAFAGRGATGSDIAFTGNYAIMGNYRGFQTYDISNPRSPKLVVGFLCPTSQGDPTVYGNLLFVSGEN